MSVPFIKKCPKENNFTFLAIDKEPLPITYGIDGLESKRIILAKIKYTHHNTTNVALVKRERTATKGLDYRNYTVASRRGRKGGPYTSLKKYCIIFYQIDCE